MDLNVTISAISVLRVEVVLRSRWLLSPDAMGHAVASKAKLGHPAGYQ
jgi:hypothetical protein